MRKSKKKKLIKVASQLKGIRLPTGEEITHFPCQAPWMNWGGACLVNIVGLRNNMGIIEAQIADEYGIPYRDDNNKYQWVNLQDFPHEWPK